MSNSTASVSVVCPCGDTFERLIQRGRPAIWCPKCRELPIAKRPPVPTSGVVVDAETGEETEVTSDRVSRFGQHDWATYEQRERIEAGMAALRGQKFESDEAARLAAVAVYHAVDPVRWPLR